MTRMLSMTLLLAGLLAISAAHAQTGAAEAARQADVLQRQSEERIRRDIEEILPQRPDTGAAGAVPTPKVDASAAGPSCHDIRDIVINGAPHLSPSVRAGINARFLNRCLGVAEIEQILAEITRDYISRGYITTRAYLPSQNLSQGRLEILVVEGRVGKIELQDGGRNSIRPGLVFPSEGELFNLRDFEQGIEQVNRLSSNNAQLDIQPGDAPGTSRVLVLNQPGFPLHAFLGADNYGADSTGRNQVSVGVTADRLLKLNELIVFTHRRSQPYDGDRRAAAANSLSLFLPFGYSTLGISASRSSYATSVIPASGQPLRFHGDSDNLGLRFSRVVYRGQASRAALAAGLTGKSTHNYLEDELLAVSSRRLALFDLEASASMRAGGGALSMMLDYVRGLSAFGALQDPAGLPGDAPHAQFDKLHYELSWLRPFRIGARDAEFSTQLVGQLAPQALYGSEQQLIGGVYSVRGFSKNTLSGDRGWYARNELALRHPLAVAGESLPLRFHAGIDFGAVSSHAVGNPGGHLSGAAIGVAGAFRRMSFDIFYARAISQPDFLPREGGQFWLRLNAFL